MMKEETLAKPLMPTLHSNEAMVRHFPYPSSSTLNRGGVCGRGESTPIPTCEFHGQTPQEEDSDGWISAVEDELQLDTVCNKKLPHLSDGGDFGCVSFVDAPDTFLDADSEPPAPSLYLQRTVSDDSGSFTMECTSPLTPASSLCSEISFESWCNEEAYDSSSVPMAYRLPTQRATHDPKPRKGRNQNAINGSRKYADTLSFFPSDSSNMHKRYEKTQVRPSELRETIRNVRPIGNQRYSQPKRTHVMKLDAGRSCNHSFLEMKTHQDNGTNGLQLKTCQRNQQEKIFRFSSAEFPMFFRQDSTSSKEMYRFCKGNVSLLRSISDLTETSPRRAAHVRSRSMSDGQWRDSDEGLRTLLRRKKRSLVEELLTKIYCSHLGDGRHSSQSSDTEWSVQSETERERLNETILRNKDVEELSVLVKQLKDHVHQIAADLVRHLTRRDNLRNKRDRNYDVVTAILQAVSPKRCVDTRMRFSVEPRSGDSGFIQWHDAMKMVARLPGGIPADFRKRLWLTMSEKHLQTRQVDWEQAKRFCFNDRSNPDDDELGTQIVKDLHRTGCSLFCGEDAEHNQALLKRVLLAYARWNKNVGYCQGFNMLAALILEVTDRREEDALKVMIYLIEGVLPESYFANSLRGLSVDMAVFRDLLRLRLPNLSRHLDTLQAEARDATSGASYEPPLTNVFTMQWFLTLFSNCLPKSTVLRVWDLIFLEGNEVLLRTALAIWDGLSDRIMTVESADEFYSIMRVLTREMLEFGLMDANHLVKTICVLAPFPFPQLAELRDKYTYNITPFTAAIGMAKRAGLRLFYSDDEEEDDDQMAVAAWCFSSVPPHQIKARGEGGLHPAVSPNSAANFNTIGPGAFGPSAAVFPAPSQPTVDIDRMSLDISALKKQYAKLKERQKQAHVILTSAARMPKATSHRPPPIAVNHLLVGKKPLTSKRSTAQKGTIHLVVQNKPAPIKPIKSKSQQVSPQPHESGETLFWNKAKHDRRMSLQETIDIQRITTKKVEEIDEDSSSSTSTELCDEDRGSLSDFGSEMDDSESSGLAVRVAAVRDVKNPSKIGSETSSSDSAADGALSLTAIGEPSADDCSSSDRLDESSVTTVTSDETLCPRVDTSQTKWWYLSEDGAAGGVEEPAADPGKEIPSPDWATEKLQEKKDSSSSSSLSSNQHDDSSSSSFTRWLASVDKGNSSSPSTNTDLEKSKSGDSLSSDSDIKAWVQGLGKSSINETNSEVNVNSKSQCETETALQDAVDVNISDQRSGEMDHGTDKDQSECYSDTLQPRSADTVDTGFSSSEFKFDLDVSVPREDQDRASMAIVAMQTEDSGRASSAETDSARQSRVSEPSTEVGEGPAAQSPLDLEALNFKLSSSSSSEGSSSVDGYQKGDCESETDAKISEILAWTAFTFDESKDEEDKDDDSKRREPESSCIPARPSLSTQSRWSLPEGDVTLASLQRHSWSPTHPVTEQQDAESRRFSEGDKTKDDTLQRLQGAHAKDTHATLQRTGSSPACNGKDNKAKKTKNLVSSISLQSPTAPITFNPFPTLRRAPSEVGVKLGLYTSPGSQKSDKSSKSSSSPTKGRFFW